MIDQGFVSLANFGLGVIVARLVTPTEFGAFGVVFALYLVALNVARGFATQPLAIRFGGRDPQEFRRGAAEATGVALTVGLAGSAVCLVLAGVLGGVVGVALSALAVGLPGLLVQDAWRFVLFTARRGRVAIVNDVIANLVMALLIAIVVVGDAVSVFSMVLCWGGGSLAAALVGILQTGVRPRPIRTLAWCREHWDITPRFLGSELIQMGGAQLVLFALGAIVGLDAVGSIRGAQLLTGPMYVMAVGVTLSMVPEAARVTGSLTQFRRINVLVSGGLLAAGACWGLVLLLLPDSIGRELLGDSWAGARSVLLPITLSIVVTMGVTGPRIGLRALEAASATFRAGMIQFILTVVGGTGGAIAGGTVGAAWGLALGIGLSGIAWWLELVRAMRHLPSGARTADGYRDGSLPGVAGTHVDLPIDPETLGHGNP